jgi:hypothetical protein
MAYHFAFERINVKHTVLNKVDMFQRKIQAGRIPMEVEASGALLSSGERTVIQVQEEYVQHLRSKFEEIGKRSGKQ